MKGFGCTDEEGSGWQRSKRLWVAVIKEVLGGRDQRDYGWQ